MKEERRSFIGTSCEITIEQSQSQTEDIHENGNVNNNVQDHVKNSAGRPTAIEAPSTEGGAQYTKLENDSNPECDSSSLSSYEERTTNRQEYDRRLSVFLGTQRPFQRRRTREEQEIETNFRWSMCLFHKHTLIFFACIAIFLIGIAVSFALKK